jgi:exopolysaccharide production protein ExoQ
MNSQMDIAEKQNVGALEGSSLAFAVGFFFSLRISIVLFSVRILGIEPSTGAEIGLALNLLLLGVVCFDSGPGHRTLGSIWVLAFLIFSCCSLAWSETASLPNSTAYWCGMFTDVAIVVLLLRDRSVTGASHSLLKGFIWSTCCLALIAWIMPAQSDLRLGDEDYFNANQIGNLCAFAILFAQYLMRRKEGKWGLAIFFLVITLFRSLSKTTLVAFLVSESFLVIQDRSIRRKTKIMLIATVTLIIFAFWGLYEAYFDIYTTADNQAETLTGRTAIWLYVLGAISDHPWNLWIGHGFDSMWHVIPLFAAGQFEARHAENELLQQLYAYGLAGVVLLGLIYGSLYRQIRKLSRGPVKMIFLSIMLFIVVRGLAEAEPFDLLLPLWAIVLISVLADNISTAEQKMGAMSPST